MSMPGRPAHGSVAKFGTPGSGATVHGAGLLVLKSDLVNSSVPAPEPGTTVAASIDRPMATAIVGPEDQSALWAASAGASRATANGRAVMVSPATGFSVCLGSVAAVRRARGGSAGLRATGRERGSAGTGAAAAVAAASAKAR